MFDSARADERFLVPMVFRLEVIAALARRGESRRVLEAAEALTNGPKFRAVEIDRALLTRALDVAKTARLRAYDALYAALAIESRSALLTLDIDVGRRLRKAFKSMDVRFPS